MKHLLFFEVDGVCIPLARVEKILRNWSGGVITDSNFGDLVVKSLGRDTLFDNVS